MGEGGGIEQWDNSDEEIERFGMDRELMFLILINEMSNKYGRGIYT